MAQPTSHLKAVRTIGRETRNPKSESRFQNSPQKSTKAWISAECSAVSVFFCGSPRVLQLPPQIRNKSEAIKSTMGNRHSPAGLRHFNIPSSRWFRISDFAFRIFPLLLVLTLASTAQAVTPAPSAPEPAPPTTPRDFFNAGTQKLRDGKLREAEAFLESALASQSERLQPPALYNLGHTRFKQGVEELKKGPPAGPTAARG
ncbi:MAG TPA: hypothetical protein VNT26_13640, partial [Candidatus Sulfotelmatobacter sp.]|nr:hypothetical protein [Candidatus Sulfotelmatobacter sp.]